MSKAQRKLLKVLIDDHGFVPMEYEKCEWAEKIIEFENCKMDITFNIDKPSIVVELKSFETGMHSVEILRTPATKSDWVEIQRLIRILKSYQPVNP